MNRPTRFDSSRPVFVSSFTLPLVLHLTFLTLGSLLHATSVQANEPVSFSPIEVTLISDHRTIAPGRPFWLGIRQVIKPGFHTYWKNAGTVGLPAAVKWKLPEGFSAGPLLWPTPTHRQMVDYRVWGYQKEALLITKITPPEELPTGRPYTFIGDASWMCCGKQCYPGFETLKITLPATDKAIIEPSTHRRFQATLDEQAHVSQQWQVRAFKDTSSFRLEITPRIPNDNLPSRKLQFFGYHRLVSSDKIQTIRLSSKGYILDLPAEEFSPEERTSLEGIVISDPPWDPAKPKSPLAIRAPLGE